MFLVFLVEQADVTCRQNTPENTPPDGAIRVPSSEVASLGGPENGTKQRLGACPVNECEGEPHSMNHGLRPPIAAPPSVLPQVSKHFLDSMFLSHYNDRPVVAETAFAGDEVKAG